MYNKYRVAMHQAYNSARIALVNHPEVLIVLEKYITDICCQFISENYQEFKEDYDEASYTQAFWQNYPPDNRGRSPVGDQVPWIEVGEHSIGHKLCRFIANEYGVRETGLPSGADNRFLLSSEEIKQLSGGLTDSVMVFLDIKSVGPRDDFEHTVISPYQVSGDGIWTEPENSLVNSPMIASGRIAKHPFYPAITPIYALSSGILAPTIHVFVKPVYRMLSLSEENHFGQPLRTIRVIGVPNGLLLTVNPNYLGSYPSLFFPGKDDKGKAASKVRCRVSFKILADIANWRVREIEDGIH